MTSTPQAPKHPRQVTQPGRTFIYGYLWMRDREDLTVIEYLRAENDYLEEMLGHTKPL
jgi:oligopeptidase B